MSRVLICRTDAIGDLILTLPLARSIKEKYPDALVTMLVSEYTRWLLSNEEYIDGIMTVPGRSVGDVHGLKRLTEDLMDRSFDVALLVYPRFSLALATALAGIRLRAGTAYRSYSILFTKAVPLHRRESGKHELDLNYELAEAVFDGLPHFEPQLTVVDAQVESAKKVLTDHGLAVGEQFAIIHPLSRGSAPNWLIDRYLELAGTIAGSGLRVVLTGSADEREAVSSALQRMGVDFPNLAGETDLSTLLGLIKLASVVITGSTGPIHLATAIGTEAVGIYPPQQALSATRWGPRGGANKLFVPDVKPNDRSLHDCMDTVSVADVAAYVLSKCQSDDKL